jgi:hypothetical protein
VISSSHYFLIVEVVSVDGWEADTAVAYLSGEDLITVKVFSKKATIRVGNVVGIGSRDIWESIKKSVNLAVLLVAVIEMLSMLIDSV